MPGCPNNQNYLNQKSTRCTSQRLDATSHRFCDNSTPTPRPPSQKTASSQVVRNSTMGSNNSVYLTAPTPSTTVSSYCSNHNEEPSKFVEESYCWEKKKPTAQTLSDEAGKKKENQEKEEKEKIERERLEKEKQPKEEKEKREKEEKEKREKEEKEKIVQAEKEKESQKEQQKQKTINKNEKKKSLDHSGKKKVSNTVFPVDLSSRSQKNKNLPAAGASPQKKSSKSYFNEDEKDLTISDKSEDSKDDQDNIPNVVPAPGDILTKEDIDQLLSTLKFADKVYPKIVHDPDLPLALLMRRSETFYSTRQAKINTAVTYQKFSDYELASRKEAEKKKVLVKIAGKLERDHFNVQTNKSVGHDVGKVIDHLPNSGNRPL